MQNKFLNFIEKEKQKDYFIELLSKINESKKYHNVFPNDENIFECFKYFEPEDTKVVIIGQDPYYLKNQADGLAFSTQDTKCPKSLNNIIKELKNDYPEAIIETYSLKSWAKQNILLLNSTLTVNENMPNSHKNFGWNIFVKNILNYLCKVNNKCLFVLWGNNAKELTKDILIKYNVSKDRIITSSHPSPLSYSKTKNSFKNSHIFKNINNKLKDSPIDFSLRKE